MGYLRVLWSRGCKIPYVYLTGSVRFTCGTLGAPVDSIRALEHPYVQVCGNRTVPCDQWCRALHGLVWTANARLCYIYQAKHGPVHFSVSRLKRKNKHSIYFKTFFVSFKENGLRHVIFCRGWPLLTANIRPFRVLKMPIKYLLVNC